MRLRTVWTVVVWVLCALSIWLLVSSHAYGMGSVGKRYPGTAPRLEEWIAATWPVELVDEAISVAWCESTGKPTASNGQYRGLFQMGRREWARYGNGKSAYDPIANSKGAYLLYLDRGWRPWECQPVTGES
jgi:hypothetical protein